MPRERAITEDAVLQVTTNSAEKFVATGHAHMQAGRVAEAERAFTSALAISATYVPALEAMGIVHLINGRRNESAAAFMRALELRPTPETYLHLGQLLCQGGKKAEGVALFARAREAFPHDERIAAEHARSLDNDGQHDDAADAFERALARWPRSVLLTYYYTPTLFCQGKISRAVELTRDCLAEHPQEPSIHSALLFLLHFLPGMTAEKLLEEHRAWERLHAPQLPPDASAFPNDRAADRRLRIGYVSPDFKNHGVGRFIAPILAAHDRKQFEVFAYADGSTNDAQTQRIRGSVDQWRQGYGKSHAQLAQMIRADGIDILVDLCMHMPMNRMPLFAGRAAPVQVTYLAYCGTTGLSQIDFRLSDPHLDPKGWEPRYVERTMRLPQSWWLYEPPALAPEVQQRPADAPITFGCLNNIAKVSPDALKLWATILQKVEGSRLLLHSPDGKVREEVLATFGALGVEAERVTFAPRVLLSEYLAQHHEIDIALDPFPYAGGTTTCDALWMGVPVVTLIGDMAVGRGSLSVLTNIGLPELAARTHGGYVKRAVALAKDRPRLAELRSVMRGLMQSSPLMDTKAFMEGLEGAYRTMWRELCSKG